MTCYPRDREATVNNDKSMAQRYREKVLKKSRLEKLRYIELNKWSCEFALEKKQEAI